MLALVFSHLMNGDDVRMLQTRSGLGFHAKTPHELLAGKLPEQKHLHRDNPIQAHLASPIDNSHAAAGDFFQQLVIAKITEARAGKGGLLIGDRFGGSRQA